MPDKIIKQRIDLEGGMRDLLRGDALKNALDFAAYLKANDMAHTGVHCEVSCQGKCVCFLYIDGKQRAPGPWTIWTAGEYDSECGDVPMDARMKEIAWANVNVCGDCGAGCSSGSRKTILGKEFDNVCGAVMAFNDPDAETLECVKKLLEMRR